MRPSILIVDTVLSAQGAPTTETPPLQSLKSMAYNGAPPARQPFTTVPTAQSELEALAGHYQIAPGVVAEIDSSEGFLIGYFPGKGESDFFPVGDHRFESRSLPVSLQFVVEGDRPTAVRMTLEGQVMNALRLPDPSGAP